MFKVSLFTGLTWLLLIRASGMNVLAAPFLYVMPELDAYNAFSTFIHHACPLYVQPALDGVHCGIKVF
jgi:cell cycle arrest protein BUB2